MVALWGELAWGLQERLKLASTSRWQITEEREWRVTREIFMSESRK